MTSAGERRNGPRPDTLAVHAGSRPDPQSGAVVTPIFQSSTFLYPAGDHELRYTRYGNNPTQMAVHEKLAALEGAEAALALASGMAAIATAILSICSRGDHVVAAPALYGGTHALLDRELPRLGIEVTYADDVAQAAWERATRSETRLWLWEAISNPLLRVADGPALAARARERGITTLVDATFASPVHQRPVTFGADLVMQSGTKYLGGHSDLIAGTLAGSAERIRRATEMMHVLGGSIDPHAAFLLERGMKTLAVRMARHSDNGRAVAEFLAAHPRVEQVHYPTLPDHPDSGVALRVLTGGGGVVTFVPRLTAAETEDLVGRFRWIKLAPSLGGVESLVSMPSMTSHRMMSPEKRRERGIPDAMVRLALGIEDASDLIDDLDRGLSGP
ncbi:MAG TPA: aminotransferase class I/II-fold pyridoxal phosphate-dependent enzyme [Gemmatimonadota bacterium]|nr:aminotransferase class I/II-fold pyridoxal phosphate-dependent enzyme [Gemmatimonadota bacterium]